MTVIGARLGASVLAYGRLIDPVPWAFDGGTRALQAYLGHRNIQHTVRYSEMSPTRFKDFWRR